MPERQTLRQQIVALPEKRGRVPHLTHAAAQFRQAIDMPPLFELYVRKNKSSFFGKGVDEVQYEEVIQGGRTPFIAFRALYGLPTTEVEASLQAHVSESIGSSVQVLLYDAPHTIVRNTRIPTDRLVFPAIVAGEEVLLEEPTRAGFTEQGLDLMSSVLASIRVAQVPDAADELMGWTKDSEVLFHPRD